MTICNEYSVFQQIFKHKNSLLMLQKDPIDRLGSGGYMEVMRHPFFDEGHRDVESLTPPYEFVVSSSDDVLHFDADFTQIPVEDFDLKTEKYEDDDVFKDFDFCSDAMKREILAASKESNNNL